MFTHYLFLIFAMLLATWAPDVAKPVIQSPWIGFEWSLLAYWVCLGIIFLQCHFRKKFHFFAKSAVWPHSVLLIFLLIYFFICGAHRIFEVSPLVSFQSLQVAFALLLYLGGLYFYYWQIDQKRQFYFLLPLIGPYLIFIFLLDILYLFHPENLSPVIQVALVFSMLGVFLLLIIAFFPILVVKFWNCTPLPESELKKQLSTVCEKAHFKHGGMLVWNVMNHTPTAAIIGVIPKYRYILFTQSILDKLAPSSLEAVLAHEIGHSQRGHLWILPFILLGMSLFATAAVMDVGIFLFEWLEKIAEGSTSLLWQIFLPLSYFLFYAIVIALYFRLVFGYFSRIFERQADLHVIPCHLSLNQMITALHDVGIHTGNTHLIPNWHHYSIQERIDFLRTVINNPKLEKTHHMKVWISLAIYTVAFMLLLMHLTWS